MGDSPRRWYRIRLRTLLLLVLLATIGLSVYSYWVDYRDESARRERELLSPPRGAVCRVVFRRELLGLERVDPTASTTDGIANSVVGRFILMNDQWIVIGGLADEAQQQWIPRENVLLLRINEP